MASPISSRGPVVEKNRENRLPIPVIPRQTSSRQEFMKGEGVLLVSVLSDLIHHSAHGTQNVDGRVLTRFRRLERTTLSVTARIASPIGS